MANLCDVQLQARGFKTKEEMRECEKLLQNGGRHLDREWIPLFDASTRISGDTLTAEGWCKWNTDGLMEWSITQEDADRYPTLRSIQALARKYGIYIEILGTESGCNVGEHFGISPDGKLELEEHFDFAEYDTGSYGTYSAFVADYGDVLTEEEFHSDDWVCVGEPDTPFGDWISSRKIEEVKDERL